MADNSHTSQREFFVNSKGDVHKRQTFDEGFTASRPATGGAPASAHWYIIHAGQETGPLSLGELLHQALGGKIDAEDLIRQDDGLWTKARDVPYLQGHFFLKESKERTFDGHGIVQSSMAQWKTLARTGGIILAVAAGVGLCIAVGVAISRDLTGTTWQGSENLEGFGYLRFEFRQKGVVLMTDAMHHVKGKVAGTWSRSGSDVTITFANCVYRGVIQDSVLSGTAYYNDFGRTWSFSIKRG